ncbi:MAG TPA: hypothetical protein DCO75_02885 [Fibrobacteres bacterium]|jgi:hypothetical protein|nr:hypothetical protein [Fibrobacterota bacterium]
MKRLSFALICLLFALCTTPPVANRENIAGLCSQFFQSEKLMAKGFGELRISANGQKASAKFGLQSSGKFNANIDIYSFFGKTIAALSFDSSNVWTLTDDEGIHTKRPEDSVFSNTDFFNYPFSNVEFFRILTGRLIDGVIISRHPDSIYYKGKKSFLYWNDTIGSNRIFLVAAEVNRKHSIVTDVIYSKTGRDSWKLIFSSFTRGIAREIRFNDINNNYFYLKYEKIVFPE